MEESTDDCCGFVVNWTIENFSCWSGDIHDPVMKAEGSIISEKIRLTFELYPKGLSGREEQLLVRLCVKGTTNPKGDLSFIASDGSLLCRGQMIENEVTESVLEFPHGPKFRDVVEHITKNESLHKDQLTLRFRFRLEAETRLDLIERGRMLCINSMIDTFITTVKIHLEQLQDIEISEEIFKGCCRIEYPSKDGEIEKIGFAIKDSKTAADSIEMGIGVDSTKQKCVVRTLWSLVKSDGSVLRSERNEHVFDGHEEDWVISNSLTKEEASQKGYSVVIDFKIIPSNGHKFHSQHVSVPMKAFEVIPTKTSRTYQTADVLKTDLMCLYQDQEFSDITLKCDNVTFPVHKNILSARSPVFKTMLSTDMKEAASGVVDIADLGPSTLSRFLTYLYTGAVEEELQCDSAFNLYYAADKYQVPSLKKECAHFLSDNASIDNVCDILSLAHKHQDDQLTSVAHTLILKNFNEVLASEQWGSFMKSEPLLALETVTEFAKNKKVRGSE